MVLITQQNKKQVNLIYQINKFIVKKNTKIKYLGQDAGDGLRPNVKLVIEFVGVNGLEHL